MSGAFLCRRPIVLPPSLQDADGLKWLEEMRVALHVSWVQSPKNPEAPKRKATGKP